MALSMRSSVAAKAGTRGFLGKSVRARATNGVKATMRAGNWLPGSDAPAWLPDDIPGNFGFDPLGLAKDPASLARFREAELIHCRWSMLAAAGILLPEILGYGNFIDATKWPETAGGHATWFGIENPIPDVPTLLIISHILFILSEGLRQEEKDPAKKLYPGGAFDPLGFSKDSAKIGEYQLKEIKNGRLAMIAVLGFASQYAATGKGPVAALSEHLASPWTANFTTNGVSVPFF